MKEIWTAKVGRVAARYGEHAPVATACCNACRTCVTTNLVGIVTAAIAGAGAAISSRLPSLRGSRDAAAARSSQRAPRSRSA